MNKYHEHKLTESARAVVDDILTDAVHRLYRAYEYDWRYSLQSYDRAFFGLDPAMRNRGA